MNPDVTVFVELVHEEADLLRAAHGKLVPMDSRHLIERVLGGEGLDPEPFLARWRASSATA